MEHQFLKDAAIVLKLTKCSAVGVVGDDKYNREVCKNILLDLSIRQYYSDLKIFFVIEEEYSKYIEWIRLLPHLQNDDLGKRNIVCEEESRIFYLNTFIKKLSRRENDKIINPRIRCIRI